MTATHVRKTATTALCLALAPTLAMAQDAPLPTLEACAAVTVDADRLACYDALARRSSGGPREADHAAERARQALEARTGDATGRERRRAANDIFRHDDAIGDAIANVGRGSLLDSRWELARDSKLGLFNFRAYKPVYLLPAFWSSNPNRTPHSPNPRNTVTTPEGLNPTELKFQLGFKTKVAENLFGDNGDVWLGYTQSSRWQAYNADLSRPFRETNYEPEAMLGVFAIAWFVP